MALFELRDITTGFDGRPVLRGLSLDIEAGEVVTLIGESGVGKTLLLKHMLGLMPIDSGTIRFDGQAVERLRDSCIDEIIVTNSIHMPEDKRFDKLTVLSVAALCSEAIRRIHNEESVSSLFL